MANSWKIGAISGLIASLFTGTILAYYLSKMAISMELFESWWVPFQEMIIVVAIPLNIILGIILGIIYSKIYPAVPGKGALKGLCWGLVLYVIIAVRIDTFWFAYGMKPTQLLTWLHIILWGLITGIIYEYLCNKYCPIKEVKIKKYNLISGFHLGAIAGLFGGMAASVFAVLGPGIGLWKIGGGTVEITLDFWWAIAGNHIWINILWGIIFGLMFTQVYDLVPGKKITKGLVYGLTLFLLTTFLLGTYWNIMAVYAEAWLLIEGNVGTQLVGFAQAVVFGLVLGLLYRKPTESPAEKKEKLRTVEIANCIHCNATITKGSKYCKDCGKQQ
jgi:hypothetical protein